MMARASAQGSQPALAQQRPQRRPGHVLHGQVEALPVVALVEDRDDVLVGEPRHRLGLADEPVHEFGVARQVGVHDFKRHLPVEPGVGGEVDGGHAAVRDAGDDVVTPVEHPPREQVRGRRFHYGRFYGPPAAGFALFITLSCLGPLRLGSRPSVRVCHVAPPPS